MEIIKFVCLVLGLLTVSYLLGRGFLFCINEKMDNVLSPVLGWLVLFSVAEIFVVPLVLLKASFAIFCILYGCTILILCIPGIISLYRYKARWVKKIDCLLCLGILLVLVQVALVVFLQHSDADDTTFIGNALTSLETNTLYQYDPTTGESFSKLPLRTALSGISMVWAFLSKVSGVAVAIITYNIIPVFLISCSYILWWYVGKELFKNNKESQRIFFIFMSVLNIFGNYTVYTTASFLLFRIWQGKAILANIILPGIWLAGLHYFNRKDEGKRGMILMLLMSLAGCCVSSMSVPLVPVAIMGMATIRSIASKKMKFFIWGCLASAPCIFIGTLYVIFRSI